MTNSLPRITITLADRGESDSSGDLNTLGVGFGLHLAWMLCVMLGAAPIFGADTHAMQAGSPLPYAALESGFATFGICLLTLAFTNQLLLRFYVSKKALVLAALLSSAGTLGMFGIGAPEGFSPALAIMAGIGVGAGLSLTTVLWGTAYARFEFPTIILNTIAGMVLGVAVYMVLLHWVPVPYSGLLATLLPLGEAFVLWQLTPVPYFTRREIPIFHPLSVRRVSFTMRVAVPTFIFGVVLGALGLAVTGDVLPNETLSGQLVIGAAACLAILLVLAAMFFAKQEGHWDMLFRVLIPFVGIGLFALAYLESGDNLLANFFVLMAFICLHSLTWVFCTDISQELRLSPIFVVGMTQGILALGVLAGLAGAEWFNFDRVATPEWRSMALLLAALAAYALLPRQREMRRLVTSPTAGSGVSEMDETRVLKERVAAAQAASAGVGGEANVGVAANATAGTDAGRGAAAGDAGAGANVEVDSAMIEHDDADETAPSAAARGTSASENASGNNEEDHERAKGRFHAKCEIIADTYLLSRRESEVMFLLAKGHNAAFIQDKLCISRSTAKTHINHIYRKLDIHTQQELLRMLDEIQVEK